MVVEIYPSGRQFSLYVQTVKDLHIQNCRVIYPVKLFGKAVEPNALLSNTRQVAVTDHPAFHLLQDCQNLRLTKLPFLISVLLRPITI
jgi:hypothetical protein